MLTDVYATTRLGEDVEPSSSWQFLCNQYALLSIWVIDLARLAGLKPWGGIRIRAALAIYSNNLGLRASVFDSRRCIIAD